MRRKCKHCNFLVDICAFLSDDKLAKLSPNDRKVADNLIQRSKTQLSAITKISLNTEEDDRGSYVDMSGKTGELHAQSLFQMHFFHFLTTPFSPI